jgi:hypothetical protein
VRESGVVTALAERSRQPQAGTAGNTGLR